MAMFVAVRTWSRAAAQEVLQLAHADQDEGRSSSHYGGKPRMEERKVAPKRTQAEAPVILAAQAMRWLRRQLSELLQDSEWVSEPRAAQARQEEDVEEDEDDNFWLPQDLEARWEEIARECKRKEEELQKAAGHWHLEKQMLMQAKDPRKWHMHNESTSASCGQPCPYRTAQPPCNTQQSERQKGEPHLMSSGRWPTPSSRAQPSAPMASQ